MNAYSLHRGRTPLLVSLPHVGHWLPDDLKPRLVERALACEDTDWHLDHLYAFAAELGASVLVPRASRIVVDLNRPPDNQPMYAGANNTELCPTRFFTGEPIYRDGQVPTPDEVATRVARWWRPYHDALATELARLRAEHGHALLFDGHSIKSELPWLFEGTLPNLNLGTASGASCAPALAQRIVRVFESDPRFTHVHDGRFKGGHITRHYGRPQQGIHALQLEMTWRTYMDEAPPWRWEPARAAAVTPLLRRMVQAMIDWRPHDAAS